MDPKTEILLTSHDHYKKKSFPEVSLKKFDAVVKNAKIRTIANPNSHIVRYTNLRRDSETTITAVGDKCGLVITIDLNGPSKFIVSSTREVKELIDGNVLNHFVYQRNPTSKRVCVYIVELADKLTEGHI